MNVDTEFCSVNSRAQLDIVAIICLLEGVEDGCGLSYVLSVKDKEMRETSFRTNMKLQR